MRCGWTASMSVRPSCGPSCSPGSASRASTPAGFDAGAKIITDFFKEQLQQFMTDDLDPLGRQIIELVMNDAPLEDYLALTPLNLR